MNPSISTSGMPLIVAISITRTSGMGDPPLTRNSVCRGDALLSVKESSKTLGVAGPEFEVTLTLVSASRITCGTGTATTGPIINVRWIPLSTGDWSWNSLRQRDVYGATRHLQLRRSHHSVRVAEPPVLFGIAQKAGGQVVEAVALHHDVLLQQCKIVRVRQHAPVKVRDGFFAGL